MPDKQMRYLSMKSFNFLVFAVVALFGLMPAAGVKAHDPIILTDEQITPADGPLLVDGTVSFALYGSLESPGDTRGFRVKFSEGDPLYLSLLIPDLSPENALDDASLPYLEVVDPSGAKTKLVATERVTFAEPYTGTNYVRLIEQNSLAVGGVYSITIKGDSSARFTVSVGQKEMFGTPIENISNRDLGVGGVMAWYGTSSTPALDAQSPTMQSNEPEVLAQTENADNNQSPVLTPLVAAIIAVAIAGAVAFKASKNRSKTGSNS